jgi:hypothetical protein
MRNVQLLPLTIRIHHHHHIHICLFTSSSNAKKLAPDKPTISSELDIAEKKNSNVPRRKATARNGSVIVV